MIVSDYNTASRVSRQQPDSLLTVPLHNIANAQHQSMDCRTMSCNLGPEGVIPGQAGGTADRVGQEIVVLCGDGPEIEQDSATLHPWDDGGVAKSQRPGPVSFRGGGGWEGGIDPDR